MRQTKPRLRLASNSPVCPPEHPRADRLEDEVRQPDDQMRRPFRAVIERLAEHDEAVIHRYEHQGDPDADVGLAPVHPDAQRNAHQGEAQTGEGKRHLLMNLEPDLRGWIAHQLFQLALPRLQLLLLQVPARHLPVQPLFPIVQLVPELQIGHVTDVWMESGLSRSTEGERHRQFRKRAGDHSTVHEVHDLAVVKNEGGFLLRRVHLQLAARRAYEGYERLVLQDPNHHVLELAAPILLHMKDVARNLLNV